MRETVVLPGSEPQSLIGAWRRFGPTGPVYEVVAPGPVMPTGDRLMRVRVLETREEIDYPLSEILHDPGEA